MMWGPLWGPLVAAFVWAHSQQPAPPERCTLRVAAKGVFVDGDPATHDQVIARCKRTRGAIVIVADDAPPDVWPTLRTRLERERVTIFMRGEVNDRGPCLENPLAKGCP